MRDIDAKKLRRGIERIERLEEQKRSLGGDVKGVFNELENDGFDVKTVRTIIDGRKEDVTKWRAKRREDQEILDLYLDALGMQ